MVGPMITDEGHPLYNNASEKFWREYEPIA
jgi:hypothetical protein